MDFSIVYANLTLSIVTCENPLKSLRFKEEEVSIEENVSLQFLNFNGWKREAVPFFPAEILCVQETGEGEW